MLLVDSSVWIAAQNPKSRECNTLKQMLLADNCQICTTRIIQLEITQGARTREQFAKLWDGFLGLAFLEFRPEHWQLAALNHFRCKKAGLSISTVDCMIATLAQQYQVTVWSQDKIFQRADAVLGFDAVSYPKI